MADAAKSFKGKIDELPILGKQYEAIGVTFEKFCQDLRDYAVLELDYGDDLVALIEKQDSEEKKAIGDEPEISDQDEKIKVNCTFMRKR